jgi:hypothetical protein
MARLTALCGALQGEVEQYQALGVSRALREAGYALMCVAYPLSDCRLETVEEDEVYDLQFGQAFRDQVGGSGAESRTHFIAFLSCYYGRVRVWIWKLPISIIDRMRMKLLGLHTD